MTSSAVPNTDLPGPGTASATHLRCDGCGASTVIDQDEHEYGGLVRSFLGHHSGCGNAVQITLQPPRGRLIPSWSRRPPGRPAGAVGRRPSRRAG